MAHGYAGMRVVIYARVSHDPRQRGKSVEDQVAELVAWAEDQGWVVVEIITETGSASRHQRKVRARWPEVVEIISSSTVDALLTWENSRATRQLEEYTELRATCATHRVLWGYGDDLYDMTDTTDRRRTGQDSLDAESEAGRLSQRVHKGIRGGVRKGNPNTGPAAYGYRRVYDQKTGELLGQEIDPVQAEVVREIVRRLLSGHKLTRVMTDLNRRGIPSSRGPWTVQQLRKIALNPVLAGYRVHKGQPVRKGTWPAIISDADHDDLVVLLTDESRRTNHDGATKHLMSGIAKCAECGSRCGRSQLKGSELYRCEKKGCVGRNKAFVDTIITKAIIGRLSRPDAVEIFAARAAAKEKARAARTEVAALRKRLDDHYAEAARGKLSAGGLVAVEGLLLPQIEAAEKRVQTIVVPPVVVDLIGKADVGDRWERLEIEQQRSVVRTLMTVRLLKAKGTRMNPRTVEITWV